MAVVAILPILKAMIASRVAGKLGGGGGGGGGMGSAMGQGFDQSFEQMFNNVAQEGGASNMPVFGGMSSLFGGGMGAGQPPQAQQNKFGMFGQ